MMKVNLKDKHQEEEVEFRLDDNDEHLDNYGINFGDGSLEDHKQLKKLYKSKKILTVVMA